MLQIFQEPGLAATTTTTTTSTTTRQDLQPTENLHKTLANPGKLSEKPNPELLVIKTRTRNV